MPEIEFDPKFKAQQASDYPKLKLAGREVKRIFAGLENPTYAYVHNLKAPKIVNGKAVLVEEKRKDGSTYTDIAKEFLSRPQCLGDYGVIADKGMDPDGCPMCAMAKAGEHVDPPQRRFAMHVTEYGTVHGSSELLEPFSCKLVMWTFTDKVYSQLVDIKREWKGLRSNDLILGPCTNEMFQQYDIKPAATAAWAGDEQRKKQVILSYQNNQTKLPKEEFCGKATARQWIDQNLTTIRERWAIANGDTSSSLTDTPDVGTLAEGLDDLGAPSSSQVQPVDLGAMLEERKRSGLDNTNSTSGEALDFSDLLSDDTTAPPTDDTTGQPVTTPVDDGPSTAGDDDFSSLLDKLD